MHGREVTRRIGACKLCHGGAYIPFFFPLKKQPTMLISAMPSVDAMYRPLYSIRFFREVCLALFGYRHLADESECEKYLLEFCDGSIYWTHHRKCFDPALTDLASVDNRCAAEHLAEEVAALKPEIIIIVGTESIRRKVRQYVQSDTALIIEKPFPDGKNTAEFEDVRKMIAPYLRHVTNQGSGHGLLSDCEIQRTKVHGLPASLSFELAALEIAFDWRQMDPDEGSIESLWYRNIVVPDMRRYAKLVSVFSFIESQIEILLSEHAQFVGGLSVQSSREVAAAMADSDAVLSEGRGYHSGERWYKLFPRYVRKNHSELAAPVERLVGRLNQLRIVRNTVVHRSGFLPKWTLGRQQWLQGIFSLQGTVFVSREGEQTLHALARETTDLLCEIARRGARISYS
jgi:hypothetical protein